MVTSTHKYMYGYLSCICQHLALNRCIECVECVGYPLSNVGSMPVNWPWHNTDHPWLWPWLYKKGMLLMFQAPVASPITLETLYTFHREYGYEIFRSRFGEVYWKSTWSYSLGLCPWEYEHNVLVYFQINPIVSGIYLVPCGASWKTGLATCNWSDQLDNIRYSKRTVVSYHLMVFWHVSR